MQREAIRKLGIRHTQRGVAPMLWEHIRTQRVAKPRRTAIALTQRVAKPKHLVMRHTQRVKDQLLSRRLMRATQKASILMSVENTLTPKVIVLVHMAIDLTQREKTLQLAVRLF